MWVNAVVVMCTAVGMMYIPSLLRSKRHVKGEGWTAPGWRNVADVFRLVLVQIIITWLCQGLCWKTKCISPPQKLYKYIYLHQKTEVYQIDWER